MEAPAETSLGWGHGHLNQGEQALHPLHLPPDLIRPHLVIFLKKVTKNYRGNLHTSVYIVYRLQTTSPFKVGIRNQKQSGPENKGYPSRLMKAWCLALATHKRAFICTCVFLPVKLEARQRWILSLCSSRHDSRWLPVLDILWESSEPSATPLTVAKSWKYFANTNVNNVCTQPNPKRWLKMAQVLPGLWRDTMVLSPGLPEVGWTSFEPTVMSTVTST